MFIFQIAMVDNGIKIPNSTSGVTSAPAKFQLSLKLVLDNLIR